MKELNIRILRKSIQRRILALLNWWVDYKITTGSWIDLYLARNGARRRVSELLGAKRTPAQVNAALKDCAFWNKIHEEECRRAELAWPVMTYEEAQEGIRSLLSRIRNEKLDEERNQIKVTTPKSGIARSQQSLPFNRPSSKSPKKEKDPLT